ncbi:recombination mediator RecR [Mesoterricola silvestris]|uniref:Recombination protein RecR n=1 Tax=Mesoterricola silvestris TaxID=2927979 RepID=A0AA48GLX4_9BACT|nr:recombination mediator RecR [Mesoterricola silvestris]BDU72239.1 recombination protein RecR [Mesoterricola silvestris]
MKLPAPLEAVVEALQKLPGVGAKSAQRMALHLLKEGPGAMEHLGDLLRHAATSVGFCSTCGAFTDRPVCSICSDPERDSRTLVVVAEASNVLTFERSGHFHGRYHVLGGLISPLKGVGPDQLKVRELLRRLEDERIQEIVLATNPTLDGEATASWLARILEPLGLRTTRIGLGLPIGSDLEYADDLTLDRALEGRRLV